MAFTNYLARGAEVGARDSNGSTALLLSARNGNTAIVKGLLAAGADATVANNKGRTVLMQAASWRNDVEPLNLLLAAGADVNAQDKTGNGKF